MWAELFREGTTIDILKVIALLSAMGFVAVAFLAWIFGKLVALKQKPIRRARWTAGLAYAASAILVTFGFDSVVPPSVAPLVPMPGAIVVYLWLRSEYQKGWIDDDKVPEGTKLEHDDWRVGFGIIAAVVAVAAIKTLLRHV